MRSDTARVPDTKILAGKILARGQSVLAHRSNRGRYSTGAGLSDSVVLDTELLAGVESVLAAVGDRTATSAATPTSARVQGKRTVHTKALVLSLAYVQ